ncbi:uncharacterized protein LOC105637632 isoform X2 [Jatropha curcas]|uniref:uncharacterized protein LOC105637632 isoform X2 n=1 Tax=Jatropha curcas TaxID=180498 RepID=UPI0005FC029F|nr:uncharacterized protein LOC105637632 isoform X2 [Jatropha curcas]
MNVLEELGTVIDTNPSEVLSFKKFSVHSSATKKNKEWQEKLPVVVLRAEEIMYSKANSEAEYMDLKTLWDRTNDAINTIIRRDESTETGELLQPCIEAALNLGCTPRRASRSQRNCNPRCYLSPSTQQPNSSSPGIVNDTIRANHTASPQCIPNYSNFIKSTIMNSTQLGSELQNLICQNISIASNKFLFRTDNSRLSNYNQYFPMENRSVSSLYSVYPLYYGNCLDHQNGLGILPKTLPSILEPVKVGIEQNLLSCNEDAIAKIDQKDPIDKPIEQLEIGCDLSLRLGSLSAALPSMQNRHLQDVEDVGFGHSREGIKSNKMPQMDKELSLFNRGNMDYSSDSCPSELGRHDSLDVMLRKRKAVFGHPVDDQAYHWQPKLPCNDLTGRMRSVGS